MAANAELVRIFNRMAAARELLGDNPFRANAFARAARTLRDMTENVEDLVRQDPESATTRLAALPGVGQGMAKRILEYIETGTMAEYEDSMKRVPSGLFDVLEIPGLGPKAVKVMWEELGITSIDELKARIDSPELEALPRMGKKSLDNIKKALAFTEKAHERVPIGVARPLAEELVETLTSASGVRKIDYAGSLRRGKETIGDIDILVACDDPEGVRERFTMLPTVTQVLAKGATKCSVRLEDKGVALQADLRIVPEKTYGAALLYFTGSKEHSVRLREIAIKRRLHLNEYGLFKGTEDRPQDTGAKPIAAATEEELYAKLGLPWIPPELREDRDEFHADAVKLIEFADIKAELHAHTRASDGKMSLEELAECAKERGFHTIAVTDHSASSVIANGLDADGLRRHVETVREANERIRGITLLAGSEVDILPDGRLDYEDDLLAELDIVVASPHVSLRQGPKAATERLLRAIRHPLVHIIGHPTGRIVGMREGLSPEMVRLFEAAAEHDTVLEINANWRRLDLRDTHVRGALEHGCRLAINTDAHRPSHFDFLIYGVLTGRRGGLTAEACINTWPAKKLRSWLASKHG